MNFRNKTHSCSLFNVKLITNRQLYTYIDIIGNSLYIRDINYN